MPQQGWDSVLRGMVDLHVHTAPDAFPRLLDDVEAASMARDKGLRAMVLKGHTSPTAERAATTTRSVGGIDVFGAIVLNPPSGGLSADAVAAALGAGARVVWGPTMWSRNHATYIKSHPSRGYVDLGMRFPEDGIAVVDDRGAILPVVSEILSLIAAADAVFFTGHLSLAEAKAVVLEARRVGLRKIVVSHPEYENMGFTIADQMWLADAGAMIEHTMSCHLPFWFPEDRGRYQPIWEIYDAIEAVGAARCVLTSDLGQVQSPPPTEGLREFVQMFISLGASAHDIDVMTKDNPSRLLSL